MYSSAAESLILSPWAVPAGCGEVSIEWSVTNRASSQWSENIRVRVLQGLWSPDWWAFFLVLKDFYLLNKVHSFQSISQKNIQGDKLIRLFLFIWWKYNAENLEGQQKNIITHLFTFFIECSFKKNTHTTFNYNPGNYYSGKLVLLFFC